MVFFATIGLLVIAVGIPILAMRACGQFVGQKPPHPLLKTAVMLGVGLGLLWAVVGAGFHLRREGMTAMEWVTLAWMAGSALAAQVALLEMLGRKPEQSAPSTNP